MPPSESSVMSHHTCRVLGSRSRRARMAAARAWRDTSVGIVISPVIFLAVGCSIDWPIVRQACPLFFHRCRGYGRILSSPCGLEALFRARALSRELSRVRLGTGVPQAQAFDQYLIARSARAVLATASAGARCRKSRAQTKPNAIITTAAPSKVGTLPACPRPSP